MPTTINNKKTFKDEIFNLKDSAVPVLLKNKSNKDLIIYNHEYFTVDYSPIFTSISLVIHFNYLYFKYIISKKLCTIVFQNTIFINIVQQYIHNSCRI